MAVALLDTQYTLRAPGALAIDANDCTFCTFTESVILSYFCVEVQNCTYWYTPPLVNGFQPLACIQPDGLNQQQGVALPQVVGIEQYGGAQQAADEAAISAPDVTAVPVAGDMDHAAMTVCAALRAHSVTAASAKRRHRIISAWENKRQKISNRKTKARRNYKVAISRNISPTRSIVVVGIYSQRRVARAQK